ncbi:MAG: phosphate ABC transporter permease subunit PstC [Verrucomicrobia bacterium]|nr:phosphate ABC transporter permease subunit PstC [Verrucomicrobiota bacterium]
MPQDEHNGRAGVEGVNAAPSAPGVGRSAGDAIFRFLTTGAGVGLLLLIAAMAAVLWQQSALSRAKFGWGFLAHAVWNPVTENFGALGAMYGTAATTAIALLVAVPISLGIGLFLAELAPQWLRVPAGTAIELLAAVPSIVYGMWGLFVLAPIMGDVVQPWIQERFGDFFLFSGPPIGIGILSAGLVLALMILPFISSVIRDVFLMTPSALKESAYGMGATTWEVARDIMIPYGRKGIIGAITLGLGRALGETMAVTFVIGNAHELNFSLFALGNSIASTLANEFTEADGDVYLSALIELGLVLFLMTFVILSVAQIWLRRMGKREGR